MYPPGKGSMNVAHLHLAINHLPVVGIPLALLVLLFGIARKNAGAQLLGLVLLSGLGLVAVGVYFTGEPAESVVEHMPGVTEAVIEKHEDAASVSLALAVLAGVSAAAALWLVRAGRAYRIAIWSTVGAAVLAVLSLAYTANLGGSIRHTEIRSGAPSATSPANGDEH